MDGDLAYGIPGGFSLRGWRRAAKRLGFPALVSERTLKVQLLSTVQQNDTQGSCFPWPGAHSQCPWVLLG